MLQFNVKAVGDCALSAEFENEISIAVNRQVHALDKGIRSKGILGITETVPAYRTLTIHYKPEIISFAQLRDRVLALKELPIEQSENGNQVIEIPVLYGGETDVETDISYDGWDGRETAPDMETVLTHEHIDRAEFIRRHTANPCFVYFQAFAVGHSYVGNPVKAFTVSRRSNPRTRVPKGTIAIWADQTVLYGVPLPCGWQVIGRTPVDLYNPDRAVPSFCSSGQWIQFKSIDKDEYRNIREASLKGTYHPVTYAKKELM